MTGATPGGRVVLVGTPIGNLGDLSPRASATLAEADVIYCEDTRRTRKLLSAAGIPAPRLRAMHKHNEASAAGEAVRAAASGSLVAVATDAGMPGVSDPGALVVRLAASEGVPVDVVPGPSGLLAALALSGVTGDRFCFEGFLPRQGRERRARLQAVAGDERPTVIFEAPHRVARTLADLRDACGADRNVAVARELTKLHEEVWRGTVSDACEWVASGEPKGEWTVVVAGASPQPAVASADEDVAQALRVAIDGGSDRRGAIADVARSLGMPKREVYRVATGLDR